MKTNPDRLYEVSISLRDSDPVRFALLKEVLTADDDLAAGMVESSSGGRERLSFYRNSADDVRLLKQRLTAIPLKGTVIASRTLQRADWESKWKEDFKPFLLMPGFTVVPEWERVHFSTGDTTAIYIDTAMAFGTGLHPTTRLMSRLISRQRRFLDCFLDLGTGTGILAMIAYHCGARRIVAMDHARDAVDVARANFARNEVTGVDLQCSDLDNFSPGSSFSFVAANLITDVLIDHRDRILSLVATDGYLAVSGISSSNFSRFRRSFEMNQPLRCRKIEKREGWCALLYRREK